MSQYFVKTKKSILLFGEYDRDEMDKAIDVSLDDVIQIDSGDWSILALTKQGNVYGRGANLSGELSLGDIKVSESWTRIESIPFKMKQISIKNDHSLFLTWEGFVYSCGSNHCGQLVRFIHS